MLIYLLTALITDPMEFSDHIISFETIVNHFLTKERGTHMRELILKATPLTSYTLDLIRDPGIHISMSNIIY